MKNESKSESPLIGERSAEEILNGRDKDGLRKYWIGTFETEQKMNVKDVLKAMEEYAAQFRGSHREKEPERSTEEIASRFHPERKNQCISHSYFGEMWHTLPDRAKNYICDLEQRADPSGEVQMIASLTEQRDALIQKLRERNKVQTKEDSLPE